MEKFVLIFHMGVYVVKIISICTNTKISSHQDITPVDLPTDQPK